MINCYNFICKFSFCCNKPQCGVKSCKGIVFIAIDEPTIKVKRQIFNANSLFAVKKPYYDVKSFKGVDFIDADLLTIKIERQISNAIPMF